MIGVLLDDVAQAPAIGELLLAGLEVQHDTGAALGLVDAGNLEVALAPARPVHAGAGGFTGTAGEDFDLLGNDEGRVETDTKLTNQVGVLLLVAGEVLEEVGSAGLGNGAQMSDHFGTVHADAVVFQSQGLGVLVERQTDLQRITALEQFRLGQRLEAQLVSGIRGVGNQLAQEDLLVRVQGMDHQVQQLLHLGLEAQGFFLSFHTHGHLTPHAGQAARWRRMSCRWGQRRQFQGRAGKP